MNLAFVGYNSMTSSLQCIGGKVKLAVSTRYGKGAKKGKFAGGEGRGAATIKAAIKASEMLVAPRISECFGLL